jgi:hypothetical protein
VRAHADAAHLERQIESAERYLQHFAAFDAKLRRSRVITAPRQIAIDAKYRKATSLVLERNALEREINCGESAITHLDGDVRAAEAALAAKAVKYDLILKGGRVIDPSRKLNAIRDVAIAQGRIAAIEANISADAVETIDAAGTKLVTIPMPPTPLAIRWMGLLDCPMRQSTLMGRTEVVKRHLYDTKFLSYSDWDFVMRVSRETEVRNLSETQVQYRRHNTNMSTVYRARLNETGVDIALREIRKELPDFTISRHEIAELRRVLFETTDEPQKRTLDATRQALQRYIGLNEAFREKHPNSDPKQSPPREDFGVAAG